MLGLYDASALMNLRIGVGVTVGYGESETEVVYAVSGSASYFVNGVLVDSGTVFVLTSEDGL